MSGIYKAFTLVVSATRFLVDRYMIRRQMKKMALTSVASLASQPSLLPAPTVCSFSIQLEYSSVRGHQFLTSLKMQTEC